MNEPNEPRTEIQRPVQHVQQRGPSVMERVTGSFEKMTEPKITVGIPFGWGLLFAIVLLGAIFIGHYLTVAGQSVMRDREFRERGQASSAAPFQNQQEFTDALKKLMDQNNKKDQQSSNSGNSSNAATQKISESMLSVSENMSSIANKLANNGQTVDQNLRLVKDNLESLTNTLKDDTSKRDILAKLEQALTSRSNVDTASLAKATDFQSLNTKIDQQVAAKNDIDAMRKDLSGLTTKVQDLAVLIKSRESTPGLGEEFAPKKP